MKLTISRQGRGAPLTRGTEELLRQAVRLCLLRMKAGLVWSVGLVLTDDAGIQKLNKEYRGLDRPTDVLSFALTEGRLETGVAAREVLGIRASGRPETPPGANLGDVVISTERAAEQATAYGHSYEREIVFLTVHGVLHLLGLDHETEGQRARMEKYQRQILGALGTRR